MFGSVKLAFRGQLASIGAFSGVILVTGPFGLAVYVKLIVHVLLNVKK